MCRIYGASLRLQGLHTPRPRGHRIGGKGGQGHISREPPRPEGAAQKLVGAAGRQEVGQGPGQVSVLEDSQAGDRGVVTQEGHAGHRGEAGRQRGSRTRLQAERRLFWETGCDGRDRRQLQNDHCAFGQKSRVEQGVLFG